VASDYIRPFCGYAVWVESQDGDRILIDPRPSSSGAARAVARKTPDWSIRIAAQAHGAFDRDNFIAAAEDAAAGWDERDRPEPPVIGDYISLFFPHPEWGALAKQFRSDVRPLLSEGEVWELAIRSNLCDVVTLRFAGVERVPSQFEVVLIDPALGTWQDLRRGDGYSFAYDGRESPRLLKLIVGRPEFAHGRIGGEVERPTDEVVLNCFPNPFRQNATIRLGLAAPGTVSLRIYNIKGQLVRSLVESEAWRGGYRAVIWDGRNNAGRTVASGVYMCRVTSGTHNLVQRLVLIR
jgi:hypothetical protein